MMTSGLAVTKSITVEASQSRAFEVFAHQQGSWWPREHCLGEKPLQTAIVEPRPGGRWFEIDSRGQECNWGHVVTYEPPSRVILQWQISAQWQYDPNINTELEVRFTPIGENVTLVELEHRGLEAFGEDAEKMHALFDSLDAWQGGLELFRTAAESTGKETV